MRHFDHRSAVAAAQRKAGELRNRSSRRMLAQRLAMTSGDDVAHQRLRTRHRELEQFIEDPYPSDSLLGIEHERDRRMVLEAGAPQWTKFAYPLWGSQGPIGPR